MKIKPLTHLRLHNHMLFTWGLLMATIEANGGGGLASSLRQAAWELPLSLCWAHPSHRQSLLPPSLSPPIQCFGRLLVKGWAELCPSLKHKHNVVLTCVSSWCCILRHIKNKDLLSKGVSWRRDFRKRQSFSLDSFFIRVCQYVIKPADWLHLNLLLLLKAFKRLKQIVSCVQINMLPDI